jgi:hypothetical protein
VNWRQVARSLLQHFTSPAAFAGVKVSQEGYSTASWN